MTKYRCTVLIAAFQLTDVERRSNLKKPKLEDAGMSTVRKQGKCPKCGYTTEIRVYQAGWYIEVCTNEKRIRRKLPTGEVHYEVISSCTYWRHDKMETESKLTDVEEIIGEPIKHRRKDGSIYISQRVQYGAIEYEMFDRCPICKQLAELDEETKICLLCLRDRIEGKEVKAVA